MTPDVSYYVDSKQYAPAE